MTIVPADLAEAKRLAELALLRPTKYGVLIHEAEAKRLAEFVLELVREIERRTDALERIADALLIPHATLDDVVEIARAALANPAAEEGE